MTTTPRALGDTLAATLAAVGLTERRADRLARALGFDGCGCGRRREWLNRRFPRVNLGKPRKPASLTSQQNLPSSAANQ